MFISKCMNKQDPSTPIQSIIMLIEPKYLLRASKGT
jgi:hypothetical protein